MAVAALPQSGSGCEFPVKNMQPQSEEGKLQSKMETAPFTIGEVLTVSDTLEIALCNNDHDNNNDEGVNDPGLQSNDQCCWCDLHYGVKAITIVLLIYGIWNVFICSSEYFITIHSICVLILGILSIIGGLIGIVASVQMTQRLCNANVRKIALQMFYYFFILHCIYHVFFFIETVIAYDNCPCGEPLIDFGDSNEDDTDYCFVATCQFLLSFSAGITFFAVLLDIWFASVIRKFSKQF